MKRPRFPGLHPACGLLLALAVGGCASSGGAPLVTECGPGIESFQGSNCVTMAAAGPDAGAILVPPYVMGEAGMWLNPQFNGPKFQRVVIAAPEMDPGTRRAVEDAFARYLKSIGGADARPSYALTPDAINMSREEAMRTLIGTGADGLIVVRVTHKDSELLYAPTIGQNAINMMMPESTQNMTQVSPTITDATVQAQLVRLADPAVICVGKMRGPGLTPATADNAAATAINAMQNWGVF